MDYVTRFRTLPVSFSIKTIADILLCRISTLIYWREHFIYISPMTHKKRMKGLYSRKQMLFFLTVYYYRYHRKCSIKQIRSIIKEYGIPIFIETAHVYNYVILLRYCCSLIPLLHQNEILKNKILQIEENFL